ncbi:MAG: NUDIX hydrolase [Bryobacterales bacterium]|nr:NUDIX hydrolase [Bryobacterales bacterium]
MKKLISRKVLLETPIFTVSDNWLEAPREGKIRRIMVEHGGSTVAMPVDENGRILLVRQYRYAALKALWELPAGKIDAGETPLQAAKRELAEETGYRAKNWRRLISYYPSPGFQQEKMSIFLATDLIAGEPKPDHGEENLERKWFEGSEVDKMIRNGVIVDGKTVIGFYSWRGK